jgi:uncharacterized repeat protein (TIGR01451 family)
LFLLCFSAFATAQIVNIPDVNFKNALVNTSCVSQWYGPEEDGTLLGDVDTNNNGEIEVSEAVVVQGLIINNQSISSLTGIEAFTGLWRLECNNNNLSTLTLTQSSQLIYLDCSHNKLTSLTTSFYPNGDMWYEMVLNCSYNQLTVLNIPTGWGYYVNCSNNPLIQLSQATGSYNTVAGLNADNTGFIDFNPSVNYTSLSLKNCTLMTTCTIGGGYSVFVENNPALLHATVLSGGAKDIHNNPLLQSIDLKDGYLSMVTGDMDDPDFDFTDNPALEFVCIDDLGYSYTEGDNTFFNDERDYVQVSPGVAITYYCDFTPGGGYNTISGSIQFNCGASQTSLSGEDVNINIDGVTDGTVNPDDNGDFVIYARNAGTVTPQFGNAYFTVSPATYPYNFPGTGQTQTVTFCVTANGVHPDLEVTIIPIIPARPGFDAVYKVVLGNKGTEIQSGMLTLAFPDEVSDYVTSIPAVDAQATGSLSWNFADLSPFQTREFTVTLNINSPLETPAVNIGDVLSLVASVTTAQTDGTPSDNVNALAQTVVGSLDPNDKAVSRATIALTQLDDYLYYTVRFQNTGTFYAENVVIRDILSKKLDLNTFEVVATSHSCRPVLTRETTNMEGDKLEFIFEGLNLPAAQDNEPASHGFVTYKIKPKNDLVINDVIENSAGIYFDYNAAIVTNTVTTTVTALGTDETDAIVFAIYPNPANQSLTLALNEIVAIQKISVYNSLGQLVKNIVPVIENGRIATDIGDLTTGTYFVQIVTDKGKSTKKLTKL